MEYVKRFLNQRNTLVLLLVLLAISMVANLYFGVIKPLQESKGEEEIDVWTENGGVTIFRNIQGAMGRMSVFIGAGLIVGAGQNSMSLLG